MDRLAPITGNDPKHPTARAHDHEFWRGQICYLCTNVRNKELAKKPKKAKPPEQSDRLGHILHAEIKELPDGSRRLVMELKLADDAATDAFFRDLEAQGLSVFFELEAPESETPQDV